MNRGIKGKYMDKSKSLNLKVGIYSTYLGSEFMLMRRFRVGPEMASKWRPSDKRVGTFSPISNLQGGRGSGDWASIKNSWTRRCDELPGRWARGGAGRVVPREVIETPYLALYVSSSRLFLSYIQNSVNKPVNLSKVFPEFCESF